MRKFIAWTLQGLGYSCLVVLAIVTVINLYRTWQETGSLIVASIVMLLQFSPARFPSWLQYIVGIALGVGLLALGSWLQGKKSQMRVWGTLTIIGTLWFYQSGTLALGILVWDFFNPIVLSGATPDVVYEVSLFGWFWWVWGIMLAVPGLVFLAPLALQDE